MRTHFWSGQVACGLVVIAVTLASLEGQTRDPRPVPQPRISIGPEAPPPRDRVPEPAVGTGSIRGQVVDGVTGRPVARARIRLMGRSPKGPILTDGTGGFSFAGLAPGPYTFRIERNGYMATAFPETGRYVRASMRPFMLANGESREDVSIPIFRGGSISGRLVDAYGEPLDGAMVMLVAASGQRGGMRGATQTNDLGEFRVPRIMPGRYLLMARSPGGFQGDPGEDPLPQPLPTYYPGTLKREDAGVIVVNRGESITGVEMTLAEGVPAIVQGMVVPADGQAHNGGSVTARLARDFSGIDGGAQIRPDGSFRLQLPPGEYYLEARLRTGPMNVPPRPDSELFGSTRIHVTGSGTASVAILVGRGATASGRVVFVGNRPPPASPGTVRVPIFNSEGRTCQGGQATVAPDWSFKVEGLMGTCTTSVRPMFGAWMLKSVSLRGQNIADEPFTFEPGQHYSDVQIVVTDRRTSVELRVSDETGQITREFVAIAFPADKSRWENLPRFVQTFAPPAVAPPGSFSGRPTAVESAPMPPVANVPFSRMFITTPGDYFLVALDDILQEDTLDSAVLEKLIPAATRVSLSEEVPTEVSLRRYTLADLMR